MSENKTPEIRSWILMSGFSFTVAALIVVVIFFARPLLQFIRESLMQSATSAHYKILCMPGVLPPEIMTQFALDRESLFTALDRKLDDAASNAEIRIIFESDTSSSTLPDARQPYTVKGTTIRTKVRGVIPQLDSAADAEALLHAAWGDPGDPRMGEWTAHWLVGEWHGKELGMAAAGVEQRLGHKKVSELLDSPASGIAAPEDRVLLGAAWVSAIAELAGPPEVHKLYSAKLPAFDVPQVAKTLSSTPLEIERKWQMWMYAYLAGMPPASHSMHMDMSMPGK